MADSRPGGIEKIAHLFIAGSGAGSLRARDNSHLRWGSPSPSADGGNGNGQGHGEGAGGAGVREGLPSSQTAADKMSSTNETTASPGAGISSDNAKSARNGATGRSPDGAEPVASDMAGGSAVDSGAADSATNGATEPVAGEGGQGESGQDVGATNGATGRSLGEGGASDSDSVTGGGSAPSQALGAMQALLCRAKVAAVLSGHMGPLAGPAAELFAKTLAREGSRVAMLYGPADLACLHRFTATHIEDADAGRNGGGRSNEANSVDTTPCDVLLLPDWVFQFDLWPMTRGMHAICLAYGAGSEGLMAAYGALKGLIARFGKPEELFLLPFGCNEQEETWVHERLAEMCRRFLEMEPRLAHEKPDMRVRASKLLPIEGGSEGVKQVFAAIGQPVLSIVPRRARQVEPRTRREAEPRLEPDRSEAEGPVMAKRVVPDMDVAGEVTPLVPVAAVPREGEAVLRALIEHSQADRGGYFDIWSRNGVAGTIVGSEGLIGAAGATADLLGFALWLCRQAGEIDELTSITIAVKETDDWLVEASRAMPIPVRWLTWRAFQLGGQLGLGFEAAEE